jgi:hypothetical protein
MKQLRTLFKKADDAYAAMIGGVVAVLVTILVGILVYYKIAGSMAVGTPTSAAGLAAANVNTTASTIFTLAPIVGIVMIAGIILAIVTRFGSGPSA